jgi:hypothetical protein
VVKQFGGREKMIAFFTKETKNLNSKGFEIRAVKVSKISQVVADGEKMFAVAPFTTEIKVPGGSLTDSSFMLGISLDKGKTWRFINGDKVSEEKVKKMLPNLPAELKLPKKKKPVLQR